MRKKYTPPNHNQIIRNRIKNLKQITNVKDYYVDFRKLAIQAHGMNEEERMSWFITGLKPELARHVYLKRCKTIEEAYQEADLFETYSDDKRDNNVSKVYFSTSDNANNNQSNNNSNSNYKNRQQNNNQTQLPFKKVNEYKNEICCKCNIKGHIGEYCRKDFTCSSCHMNGHTAEKCRHDIIKWTAKLICREVRVALDSCAQTSVISTSLAKKL